MDGYDNSVMVALLPITTDWCRLELPHLTLVYAGELHTQRPETFQQLVAAASNIAHRYEPITLKVLGMSVFGDEEKVDVLKLRNTLELMEMRRPFEQYNASQYGFNPHVTVGPAGEGTPGTVPYYIAFDRIGVFYGTQHQIFWFGQ